MEIGLKQEHIDRAENAHPVAAALTGAGCPQSKISAGRIKTGETIQWTIKPALAEWLARFRRGNQVRQGILYFDPITAGISITEVPSYGTGPLSSTSRRTTTSNTRWIYSAKTAPGRPWRITGWTSTRKRYGWTKAKPSPSNTKARARIPTIRWYGNNTGKATPTSGASAARAGDDKRSAVGKESSS